MHGRIFALLITGIASCTSVRIKEPVPKCIREEVKRLARSQAQNPPSELWKWEAGGKVYYYFNAPCCDQYSRLVDEDCNFVCAPDGGFTGKGDGNCPDLTDKKATLIWRDTRD